VSSSITVLSEHLTSGDGDREREERAALLLEVCKVTYPSFDAVISAESEPCSGHSSVTADERVGEQPTARHRHRA
jgi:hypothetical protein